ncbi:hypothetical protein DL89DRAFT_263671, partial [Linderina pennispora]
MNLKLVNAIDSASAILYFVDGYFASVMQGIFLLYVEAQAQVPLLGVVSIVLEFYRLDVLISSCGFFWNFMGRGI